MEGVGGWADRLKHLLLSHAALIKQDSGVTEWFEPLMQPYVHFVPVSSKLVNLSNAVRHAHTHIRTPHTRPPQTRARTHPHTHMHKQ